LEGHESTDVLVETSRDKTLSAARVVGPHTHGTGCTFAAAIAARLALGDTLEAAVQGAKDYVTSAMQHGLDIGAGHQPLGHFWHTR
jgi:hydroxymethylpyrimidine/phosphomethylpyrimidine kinase